LITSSASAAALALRLTGESLLEGDNNKGKKRAAMTWVQCLKRAFKVDINICEMCGGRAKVVACITESAAINKILTHKPIFSKYTQR
jgi:hypothetical protein